MNTELPRLLIVDDEPMVARSLATVAKLRGWIPVVCHSPIEALGMIQAGGFAAIFSDYLMPNMNGLEFVAAVRKRGCTLPVAMITGDVDKVCLDKLAAAGVADLIAKPPDVSRLSELLLRFRPTRSRAIQSLTNRD